MVDPDRSLLEDLVEIDEATLPFRTVKDPTTGGQGRSRQGKMRIAGAVELSPEGEPRRIRLAPIGDFSARSLHAFVAGTSAPGARVITDGWSGYPGLADHDHQPKVVGATPAHHVLIWIHRVFSNLKRWALGNLPWPAPRPSAPLSRRVRVPLEPPPPHRNGLRQPCSASARASDPPTTATSSDNASDPGRPGASHRPPSDPPQLEPNTGPPACLTAIETNFPKSKSSRTSPGTVREPCLERRRTINIWCDRKQREKPYSGLARRPRAARTSAFLTAAGTTSTMSRCPGRPMPTSYVRPTPTPASSASRPLRRRRSRACSRF